MDYLGDKSGKKFGRSISDYEREFLEAIRSDGYDPGTNLEDGRFLRFDTDKKGDKAGWAIYSADPPCGTYGDWRTGFQKTWRPDTFQTWPAAEQQRYWAKRQVQREEAKKATSQVQESAANKAAQTIANANPVGSENPYLENKGIKSVEGLKQDGDNLLIPVLDSSGKLQSLQTIYPDGQKRFLANGRVSGGFFPIKSNSKTIRVCEGVATGISVYEATGDTVLCAFNANNLKVVAEIARTAKPDFEIVIVGDNDHKTEGNPGVTKAYDAAKAINAELVYPVTEEGVTDFNDLHQKYGIEAVREQIYASVEPHKPSVSLLKASDLSAEAIQWVWHGYLASGKLHIFAGPPGTGKTSIDLSIAGSVSSGGKFPDGTKAVKGNVFIWSGEDDPLDTLLPRLLVMGCNPNNVYFVGDVRTGDDKQPFDPAKHMPMLAEAIQNVGSVSLIIIDPIVNAVSGDSHKNTEVRRALQPVVDLASREGAAVIGITHFSKGTAGRNPVERVTGSIAFGALARIVFAAVKIETQDGEEKRLFTRAKSNIGPDGGGFYYSVHQSSPIDNPEITTSAIRGHEPVEGDAKPLLAEAEVNHDTDEQAVLSDAQVWLEELLSEVGSLEKREIMKLAKKEELSARTVYRAKKKLKIESKVQGYGHDKKSIWSLPKTENSNSVTQLDDLGTIDRTIMDKRVQQDLPLNGANDVNTGNFGTIGTIDEQLPDDADGNYPTQRFFRGEI